MSRPLSHSQGFTLIELSIVLVIIGLIVGGVLAGQSLISAAAVRAQISQIEKFQTAANTFYEKYGYLPGDIPAGPAAQFGLAARGQYAGQGDGNGLIEGVSANAASSNSGTDETAGETLLFWSDLSATKLIEGTFTSASATAQAPLWPSAATAGPLYFPISKVSNNGYIYVFSSHGKNYFGLSGISGASGTSTYGTQSLTVAQAYAIDAKIDDGMPQSGRVLAAFLGQMGFMWSQWGTTSGNNIQFSSGGAPLADGTAFPATGPYCVQNGNVTNNLPMYYSVLNGGNGVYCGLSFRMPAGD